VITIESQSQQRLFVILISIASLMGTLDLTIINISLPTIANYFETSITWVSWISIAYLITLASSLIAFGHFADIHGYKKVYLSGFFVFTIASFFCAISPSIQVLIGCRIVQGLGASMLQAIGAAMIAIYLPRQIRGWALGMLSTFAAIGIATGPVLGGYLTQYLSWHSIFLVNIPVGICAIILGRRVIPEDQPDKNSRADFDLPGALLLFLSLGSFIFSISIGRIFGYTSPVILTTATFFIIGTAAFFYRESRVPEPLIKLTLFKNRNLLFGNIGLLLVLMLYLGTSFLLPFYFELGKDFSPDISGLFLLIPAIALIVTSFFAGRTSDRIGSRTLCITSGLCFACTMALFTTMRIESNIIIVVINLVMFGFSVGLFIAPNFRLLMSYAPKGDEGMISGIAMTVRNTGSATGIAVFTMLFVLASGKVFANSTINSAQRDLGFHAAFQFGFVISLFILLLAFLSYEKKEISECETPEMKNS